MGLFVQLDNIISPWFRSDTKITEEIFCETNVKRKVAICKTSSLPYQSRALISNLQEARKHFGLSTSKRNCFSAMFTNVEFKKTYQIREASNTRVCGLQLVQAPSPFELKSDVADADESNNEDADITEGDREGREKMGDMI